MVRFSRRRTDRGTVGADEHASDQAIDDEIEMSIEQAAAILELGWPVSADDVADARRRLAKRAHPDMGGSNAAMARINRAATLLLAVDLRAAASEASSVVHPRSATGSTPGRASKTTTTNAATVRFDHPSFTIEALPVEAFEALLIVASWLGEVVDDDPPYRLEVLLSEPSTSWCVLTLVPDAGASTVSLSVGGAVDAMVPSVDDVRDQWVRGLNQLDWDALTPPC